MASRIELLQEARRRGLQIDPQDGELLAEAERRGLLPASKADFSGVTARVDSTEAEPDSGFVRDLKMGARSVIQGAGGLVGALGGDAFNHYVVDPLDRTFNTPEPTLKGLIVGQPRGPTPSPTYREAAGALADRIGLPRPQSSQERVMGDIGEGLTGTGLTMGAGGLLNMGRGGLNALAPSIT